MQRSLLGAAVVGGILVSAPTFGITWTVTGASAGGVSVTTSTMASGSINIGQTMSGRSADQVDNPVGVSAALQSSLTLFGSGILAPGEVGFFGFQDAGGSGSHYFGIAYLYSSGIASPTLSFDASITGDQYGVMTNMNASHTGASGSGTYSVLGLSAGSPSDDLYYLIFAGVQATQTITINSGLTGSNQTVNWLDWDGTDWQSAGSGSVGQGGAFALNTVSSSSAVPSGGLAALSGGLAAALLRRRRSRRST